MYVDIAVHLNIKYQVFLLYELVTTKSCYWVMKAAINKMTYSQHPKN